MSEDGRIAALGDDREIRALAGPATTVVDLRGPSSPRARRRPRAPVSGAELTHGLDLSYCADLDDVREALAREVRTLERGAWLFGWGLDPNVFGGHPVGTAPFDSVLDGVPAFLLLFDAHSALASRRALELAGIDGPAPSTRPPPRSSATPTGAPPASSRRTPPASWSSGSPRARRARRAGSGSRPRCAPWPPRA